jgi:hypothetical protein
VEQTAPTESLALTGIDIEIIRYQSGRVIADNGTVTIQTGDNDAPENWVFGTTGSITFPDNSIQTTAYISKYKVYTALLTQSGTSSTQTISTGNLTVGVTYTIEIGSFFDFTIVGAPNNNTGTKFAATGITPSWGSGALSYDSGAPVVTVLENTIGDIWFTYNDVGIYSIYSDGLFQELKTSVIFGGLNSLSNAYFVRIFGDEVVYPNKLVIDTRDSNFTNTDGGLYDTTIEIRVYN